MAGDGGFGAAAQLGGVPEADARWFFQQFIIAVDYCHRLGIANRDVKVRVYDLVFFAP